MKYEYIEKVPDNFKKDKNKVYLGIVGSRTITDEEKVFTLIDIFLEEFENKLDIPHNAYVLVSGGAKGVDSIAEKYAEKNNLDIIVIKPNWKKYKRIAGLIRNREIIKIVDVILAFVDKPKGGTWEVIEKAKRKDISTYVIELYKKD